MKVVFDEEAIAYLERIHAWIAKDSPRNGCRRPSLGTEPNGDCGFPPLA